MTTQIQNKELNKVLNTVLRGGAIPRDFQNALSKTGDGAALIPEELKHDLEIAKKHNKSMRQYVDVVKVKTAKGHYSTDDPANFSESVELGESIPWTEQDINFKGLNFNLKRYGSFTKVSEELYNDIEYDLATLFTNTHAEKATKTENKLIGNAIRNNLAPKALADVQALKTSLNKDLNPALENEIVIVTNQDGLEKLGSLIENVRQADGTLKRYLDIYPLEVYSDDDLPNVIDATNGDKVPFIYGALSREVKLFTRDKLEVVVNKKGAGFLSSYHVIRGVEDYDVQVLPNPTQLIHGEIPLA